MCMDATLVPCGTELVMLTSSRGYTDYDGQSLVSLERILVSKTSSACLKCACCSSRTS